MRCTDAGDPMKARVDYLAIGTILPDMPLAFRPD
jgi:hypothetical protein